jgi:MSHA biogenesis protein MshG
MTTFQYTATNADGKVTRGQIAAETSEAAGIDLDDQGLIPLKLREVKSIAAIWREKRGGASWRIEDKVLFTQKFASLIKAGIPLLSALELVARQTKSADARTALRRVADQISNGETLHDAMSHYPRLFGRIYLGAVRAGESTGRLDSVLAQTADYMEREMNTRRRIREAFRYPIMVMVAIGLAGLLILKFVIPKFMSIYSQFGSDLPTPTRVLMMASDIINQVWWLLVVVGIGGGIAWKWWVRTENGRAWRDRMVLKLPLVGTLFLKVAVSRFSRLFGVMFAAGLPATTALEIVADGVGNATIADEIRGMRRRLTSGGSVAEAADDAKMPELVYEMIAIGFESGEVERMMAEVARHYDQEIEYEVRSLGDRLQPVILAVLASGVLLVALAVLMPMWNLITVLR